VLLLLRATGAPANSPTSAVSTSPKQENAPKASGAHLLPHLPLLLLAVLLCLLLPYATHP
jgi:hypothetical protein